MTYKRAIDGTNFTGGESSVFVPGVGSIAVPSQRQANAIAAMGFTRFIAGCQYTAVTRALLEAFGGAGMELHAYRYLNYPGGQFGGEPAASQVGRALDMCAGFPVGLMWNDHEDEGNSLDTGDTISFIQEAADACAGKMFSGIYTAPGWWKRFTADTRRFADFPWWDATNAKNPDAAAPLYAGKQAFDMVQYDFDGQPVTGLNVDLNVYDFAPAQPGADLVDGFDRGLTRIRLESAGVDIRDARGALDRVESALVLAHREAGGDGVVIR